MMTRKQYMKVIKRRYFMRGMLVAVVLMWAVIVTTACLLSTV